MSGGGIVTGAVVCVEAEISGDVRVGTKTIVHPCAKIKVLPGAGPIVIGESNIIEELVEIQNASPEPMVIGNNNVFEVGAIVHAKSIGDHNVFETKCFVGDDITVPSGCVFGAGTRVGSENLNSEESKENEEEELGTNKLQDNSVFFGQPLRLRIAGEKPPVHTLQVDILSRILPNYHHIKNPTLRRGGDSVTSPPPPTPQQ